MSLMRSLKYGTAGLLLLLATSGVAQEARTAPPAASPPPAPTAMSTDALEALSKQVDDLMWFQRLSDIATVDKIVYTSLPPQHQANPKSYVDSNPVIVHAYTFVPKNLDTKKKQPLMVLIHGGVHANFDTSECAHIVRELVQQGYTVISTDYRGSTGYGRAYYEDIDYGGREVDDVNEGAKWMLENYSFLDSARVGIMGWSHGGLITLMNIFKFKKFYAVAYAGVPVSDLVARLGYQTEQYRQLYSAPYHIGKTVREDIQAYRERSPVNHVNELETPLLIHTNTIDQDVNVLEVEHLIDSLKAAGKKFEYKIYQAAPGGHSFNRLDTKLAHESRTEVYHFLNGYLHPTSPIN